MTSEVIDPVTALLDMLKARGIEVRGASGQLTIDAPPGALTNELRDQLRAHKADLLEAACGICQSVQLYAYDPQGRPRCFEHGQRGEGGMCDTELVPVGMLLCTNCAFGIVVDRALHREGAA